MSAEEYIQSESTTFESPNIDSTTEIVETFIAKKAIKMAREEERRNAVNQLQIVLTAIVARNDSKINFGDIIDQFTELLNQ